MPLAYVRSLRARIGRFAASVLTACLLSHPAAATGDLCLAAARAAGEAHGVPFDVLTAITLTETATKKDGKTTPWPWAVNDGGTSHWFATRDAALRFAYGRFKAGARNFDVGCFQLNFRWHAEAFASLDQMFDPMLNADYAARFLKSHYDVTGDWSVAAGRYHSLTPEFATRYRRTFDRHRASVDPNAPIAPPTAPSRVQFGGLTALAAPAGQSGPGSLVSLGDDVRPLLRQGQSLLR